MNTQAAEHDSSDTRSDQNPVCPCHDMTDCPEQATIEINATHLARIAELLDILDGFLRHTGVANRLADYLHATGRDHPQPPHGTSYDANLLIDQVVCV
jgi:hypothetical protein